MTQTAPRKDDPSKTGPRRQRRKARTVRDPIIGGFVIIAMTVGGFGSWALTAELSGAIIAPGRLAVSSKSKTIQHLDGGIIRDILVSDGDTVGAGDVLLQLDSTREQALHSTVRGRYDSARAAAARLRAERDGLDAVGFPDDLMARRSEGNVAALLATQQETFRTRQTHHLGRVDLLGQRIAQLREEITGLEAQASAMARQKMLIGQELEGLRDLLERGFAPKTRVMALEREQARIDGERAGLLASIAKARQAIAESELQITQERTTYRKEVVGELERLEQTIADLGYELSTMSATLQRTDITAPVAGTIVGLAVHTEGAVISAGQVLMEIVPDRDAIVIEARVDPRDIETLYVGQAANVQLSAYAARDIGKLDGRITYVSADAVEDPSTGRAHFDIHVDIDPRDADRHGIRLQPGMPADVFIQTGARTPFAYLVSPLTDSLGRAWRER